MAQAMAGVDPETITYVEAHGTATLLGDPIEVAALTQAFSAYEQAVLRARLGEEQPEASGVGGWCHGSHQDRAGAEGGRHSTDAQLPDTQSRKSTSTQVPST